MMKNKNEMLKRIKTKNRIIVSLALVIVFVFFGIIYIYDSYIANWFIDKISYEKRTYIHLFVDSSVMFIPLIICIVLVFYILNRATVYSSADELLSSSKNHAIKGFKTKLSIEELINNIINNGYLYNQDEDSYYSIFSNGIFQKKVISIIRIIEFNSTEDINDLKQTIKYSYKNKYRHYKLAISIIAYGNISFSKIKKYILDYEDSVDFVFNPAYLDFSLNKGYVYVIEDIYSKTFCFHSQTIKYLLDS